MKKNLRGSIGMAVAILGLSASAVAPALAAGAKTYTIDSIMANDLQIKAANAPAADLSMGGSSFVSNLLTPALAHYNAIQSGTGDNHIKSVGAYDGSAGSTTGRKKVTGNTSPAFNVGFSDFPLVDSASESFTYSAGSGLAANFAQLPVALGGVAISYNIAGLETPALQKLLAKNPLRLDGRTLGKIFAQKITKWNDASICLQNNTLLKAEKVGKKTVKVCALPDELIHVVSRTSGSGTTYMFKDYLTKVDATDYPTVNADAFVKNDNNGGIAIPTVANSAAMATQLDALDNSIGYVEYGFAAVTPGINVAAIVNASGVAVLPNATSVAAAAAAKTGFAMDTLAHRSLNNLTGKTVYPITGYSYAILQKTQSNKNNGITAVKILDYLTHQGGAGTAGKPFSKLGTFGQDYAAVTGYVALPSSIQTIARNILLTVKDSDGNVLLNTTN
jgi:phosphate transport system substrate-binding protein